ncbi:phage tail protein, partial [Salmonella enterica subsp. salamae]|nr:phage tail protein [Salmonella enterica subsp. salamae]
SDTPQTIKIFNLRSDTKEFIGAGDAYIPPHTGLPAHSTDSEPPEIPAGQVAVFDSEKSVWSLIEDHRGQTVYRTDTGEAVWISELGPLPENVTTIA